MQIIDIDENRLNSSRSKYCSSYWSEMALDTNLWFFPRHRETRTASATVSSFPVRTAWLDSCVFRTFVEPRRPIFRQGCSCNRSHLRGPGSAEWRGPCRVSRSAPFYSLSPRHATKRRIATCSCPGFRILCYPSARRSSCSRPPRSRDRPALSPRWWFLSYRGLRIVLWNNLIGEEM